MLSTDREEFGRLLRVLCAARNVPCTEEREQAFWLGLAKMSLIQFGRAVDAMCADENPPKGLQPSQVWSAYKFSRAPLHLTPPLTPLSDTGAFSVAQRYANRLLMDWVCWHIRGHGDPIGESLARTLYVAARELADTMQMLHDEQDPEATTDRFHEAFCRSVLSLVNEASARGYREHLARLPRVPITQALEAA